MRRVLYTLIIFVIIFLLIIVASKYQTYLDVVEQDNKSESLLQTQPRSITITLKSATGFSSEKTIKNLKEIEKIVSFVSNKQNLSDEDKDIQKRNGGRIIELLLQYDSEESKTLDLIRGIPQSLGFEVLVIRDNYNKYYTDVKVYDEIILMFNNNIIK